MNDALATPSRDPSPRSIGIVYLLFFVTAAVGTFLARSLVVSGDPAATAAAMQAHEDVFRAGFAITLVSNSLYLAVTALFYRLYGPSNWALSLVAAFFSVAGCIVQIVGGLFQLGAMSMLADAQLAKAFTGTQLQSAGLFSLGLYSQSFTISLVLFAVYDLLLGWLVARSGWTPRSIGILLMAAGIGWLAFLWPPLAHSVSSVVMPLGAVAEIVLMLWLLTRGNRARTAAA